MTQTMHHGSQASQWDPRAEVDRSPGEPVDQRANGDAERFAFGVHTNGLLSLLRRHLLTILVLCSLLAVATSLAM